MLNSKILEIEKSLEDEFKKIENVCFANSEKVLSAFHKFNLNTGDFNGTTGYGYGDAGRDKIDEIFADVFHAEKALVRTQFISGTHALTVSLFGLLRPGDKFVSITGKPYDTLEPVIGITPNQSSLKSFGIDFDYIDLKNGDFDYNKISGVINDDIKLIHIQRSIGYASRDTLSIEKVSKVIDFIKNINSEIIIFVDNCYCEFCNSLEPTDVGADVVVGSLIKNLGAGVVNNGAYVVGKAKYVELIAERLTVPGQGDHVGPSLGQNKSFLLGLYMAPSVVASALKVKLLTKKLCEVNNVSYINGATNDIVLGICFGDANKLSRYAKCIQKMSAIDSAFVPEETDMPGYDSKIIMASGSFVDGSSIELSCDAPLREPYILYQQGSLTYDYGKLAVCKAFEEIFDGGNYE
ncbi:MAG: methionine gamma-lyase family protein [bacterium]|nr:methionine gamma-lyase family protein [bacterium]